MICKNSKGVKVYAFDDGRNGDVGSDGRKEDDRGGGRGGVMECGGDCECKNRRYDAVLPVYCGGVGGGAEISFSKTKNFFKNHLIFANLYVRINDR